MWTAIKGRGRMHENKGYHNIYMRYIDVVDTAGLAGEKLYGRVIIKSKASKRTHRVRVGMCVV